MKQVDPIISKKEILTMLGIVIFIILALVFGYLVFGEQTPPAQLKDVSNELAGNSKIKDKCKGKGTKKTRRWCLLEENGLDNKKFTEYQQTLENYVTSGNEEILGVNDGEIMLGASEEIVTGWPANPSFGTDLLGVALLKLEQCSLLLGIGCPSDNIFADKYATGGKTPAGISKAITDINTLIEESLYE